MRGAREPRGRRDPDRHERAQRVVGVAALELAGEAVGPAEEHALGEGRVGDELDVDVEDPAELVGGANVDDEGAVVGELALVGRVAERHRRDRDLEGEDGVEEVDQQGRVGFGAQEALEGEVGERVDDA